jgi:hypothetical protein
MDLQAPNTYNGSKVGQYASNGKPWQKCRFAIPAGTSSSSGSSPTDTTS